MPKAVAAEWFLRLFTTPDRAAAIAGDMSEEGRVSWFDLLRTAAAMFFRSVAGAPLHLLLLILCGVVVSIACWDLAIIPLRRFHNFQRSHAGVAYAYVFVVDRILITSLVGYLLVRFAKGRDITACLTYAIVSSSIPLVPMVVQAKALWEAHVYSAWYLALGLLIHWVAPVFFLLASGVLTRKRFLAQA